jgi:hypothetical protein
MDEAIRNLGPLVGVLLIGLYGWLDVRRMHRKRHRPPPNPAE